MPRFVKDIIRPGTYHPWGPGGKRYQLDISPERIAQWAKTFNELRANGNRIPAVLGHDAQAVPVAIGAAPPGPAKNVGYWESVSVANDGTLYGILDTDAETVAKVRDVSLWAEPLWKDGKGIEYKDAITHIALVNHPIMPGQDAFVPAPVGGLALCMSADSLADDAKADKARAFLSLETILDLLADLGIGLPGDTNETNFFDRLGTALTVLKSSKEKEEGEEDGNVEKAKPAKPAAVVMSHNTFEQFAVGLLTSLDPPGRAGKPYTEQELRSAFDAQKPQPLPLSADVQRQLDYATSAMRQSYRDRLAQFVKDGRIPKATADSIAKTLEAAPIALSAEAKPASEPLDLIFSAIENIPKGSVLTTGVTAFGAGVQAIDNSNAEMDEEKLRLEADRVMKQLGLVA